MLQDVLAGLGFLHSRNEVYGDLKPSNILIGGDGRAKLGDFGGVVGVGTQKTSNSAECGTMQFWAPEMFDFVGNDIHASQAGDMWAFGLIVLELLTGQEWIAGKNSVEIAESVKRFDIVSVCRQAEMSSSVEALLCYLLSKNPVERLPSAELIRSGRLRSILGEETPLSQFIREELDSTRSQLRVKDNTIDRLEKEIEQIRKGDIHSQLDSLRKEKEQIQAQLGESESVNVSLQRQLEQMQQEKEKLIEMKDEFINQQAQQIKMKDEIIDRLELENKQKDKTIAELTKKLEESVAMEKRLNDKLSATHSKMVALETQRTDAAKDVIWTENIGDPENAITVWDPTRFQKEGPRITSLVDEWKTCFFDTNQCSSTD
ncbi:putative Protein kinase domain containing protein [Blattamonas nauphoetae]|uniref:Protein kinase domain-containing protein n=1 Tax=Blattamonas nauphoetae TaxID=2049346 RepID=A0ABQ9XDT1_9EUKA|nr:putative Protein kinase domain containing protein [Blattamonas nauphoetae]